jgi:hypothetical protein
MEYWGPIMGADLTDAAQTITLDKSEYVQRIPQTANRIKTVSPTGISRNGLGAIIYRVAAGASYTFTVTNGGPGGEALYVAAAGEYCAIPVRYNSNTGEVELGLVIPMQTPA